MSTQSIDAGGSFASYRETRFFASLDGLRCFCILLVLWHHSPAFVALDRPDGILGRGFTGVDFFFVLSGFLITTLLLREEDRDGRFSLRGFYRRRILRIVPVYFLVVTLVGGWFVLVKGEAGYAALWPYYYGFLSNFLIGDIPTLEPTWSLSVEEQYYMLWPLLLLLLPMLRARVAVVMALLGWSFAVQAGYLPQPGLFRTANATVHVPLQGFATILIGALLAMALHHPRGHAAIARMVGWRGAPVVLFLALFLAWEVLPDVLRGWPNFVMHPLMAAIIASLVIRPDHAMAPVLTWRPVARIGAISYGLYLWHMVGRHFGHEFTLAAGITDPWLGTLIYIALSIVIAEISFRFFETYFLKLKTPRERRPRPVTTRVTGPGGDQAG